MKGGRKYYNPGGGKPGSLRRQPNLNLPLGGMTGASPFAPQRAQPFDFDEQMQRMAIYKQWTKQTSVRSQTKARMTKNWKRNLDRWFNTPSTPRGQYMPRRFRGVFLP